MLWVARDRSGVLYFHDKKPVRSYGRYETWNDCKMKLPESMMPYVLFEDGPVRVTIKSLGK